jgi:hypothetical protein
MTEDHQDENLPNSDKPKAIVRRLTWPIDPSLPSRDVKTDRGPDGGSTAIPLGCDRRTRKFSSPLAPFVDVCVPRSPPPPLRTAASSTRASQGRHHQARHRHGPGFFAQAGVGIPVTGTYHHRTPCCAICARHLQHLRRRASFQGRHHQRRTRPHRVIFQATPKRIAATARRQASRSAKIATDR